MPRSRHVSPAARRRQAGDVGLDERLDHVRREAADEDEREVARVGEARLVERHRLREVPLIDGRRRLRLTPPMIAAERGRQRPTEHDIRAGHLIREQPLSLRDDRGKRRRIRARLREPQIQQLEHRLEILRRASSSEPFGDLAEVRHDGDGLAREHPVERRVVEPADASRGNHVVGGARRDEVGIARQRRAAGRGGAKQNLILFQRRRLEDDGGAVGQRPLGDAAGTRRRLDDGARLRRRVHQRLSRVDVHVRLDAPAGRGLHGRGELRLIGQRDAGRLRRRHDHQAILFGKPLRARAR